MQSFTLMKMEIPPWAHSVCPHPYLKSFTEMFEEISPFLHEADVCRWVWCTHHILIMSSHNNDMSVNGKTSPPYFPNDSVFCCSHEQS